MPDLRGRPVPDPVRIATNSARALAHAVLDDEYASERERALADACRHLSAAVETLSEERVRR